MVPKNFKSVLTSVISDGEKSPHINTFIEICRVVSEVCIKHHRFRNLLLEKTGLSVYDLSIDSIAQIFKAQGGKFGRLEKYYQKEAGKIKNLSEDFLFACLLKLIKSSVNQYFSDMRNLHGEIYFKIRKSYERFRERNRNEYKILIYRDESYIYDSALDNFEPHVRQIPKDSLLESLFGSKIKTHSVPEVTRNILAFLKTQNNFCKAIKQGFLMEVLNDYYNGRLNR